MTNVRDELDEKLLSLGHDDVAEFNEEKVEQWVAAALRDRDYKTIEKAVSVMRKEKILGSDLLKLTAADLRSCGIPMGPAADLAGRIQGLQARKT